MNTPRNPPASAPDDSQLALRARALYRDASQHVDPRTARQLRAARQRALAAARTPRRHAMAWMIPTGAFAVLALAALVVWQPAPREPAAAAPAISEQAVGSLGATDNALPPDADTIDPNLYQNLDFYGWLAANENQASPSAR